MTVVSLDAKNLNDRDQSAEMDAFIQTNTHINTPAIVPEIRAYLAAPETPLWHLTARHFIGTDTPPCFWAVAWPGGQALARYVLDHPWLVSDRTIIDIGAGSGITSIAAMKAGALSVLAVDCDPMANRATILNADLNNVVVDTASSFEDITPDQAPDLILAGDICYDEETSSSLLRWIRLMASAGSQVLLADPGRSHVPQSGLSGLAEYKVKTAREIEDSDYRMVTVWDYQVDT